MKTVKVMGIIGIILTTITLLCTFGGAPEETIGLWAIITLFFGLAQSIVGVVQGSKSK